MREALPLERERGGEGRKQEGLLQRVCMPVGVFQSVFICRVSVRVCERLCVCTCVYTCEGAGVMTHRAISAGVGSLVHYSQCVTP